MILQHLNILHYKNISSASLDFSPKLNGLIGNNGAGKTNLLDAVYFLSFCRSAFNPADSQVMQHDADFFMVDGRYLDELGQSEAVSCGMKRGQPKQFKRNQKKYKRLSDHIGFIPLIFVSPSDVALIESGSDERRRLLDVVIAQYDHTYIEALAAYNRALQQRNALLKMEDEPNPDIMEIWEREMAEKGEYIFKLRSAFVDEFIPVFQEIYRQISSDSESVSLRYVSHCQRGPLLEVIQRDRFRDRAVGYSLHGIHRDDLEMMLGGYAMRREGSQGQNKTYVLALKLAQFEFLKRTSSSTTPLLLLDDIFDKLDARRVERIVELVSGDRYGQIFISDTNRDHLDSILQRGATDYKLFTVEDGEITERVHPHV